MGNVPRFELFVDCLWGLTLIAALHLLPFRSIASRELRGAMVSPAPWLHVTLLVSFVYIYLPATGPTPRVVPAS